MNSDPDDKAATDLALKQYDTLMRYFAYENQVYWTRSQHFLVANAALLGFIAAATKSELNLAKAYWLQTTLLYLACSTGIALSWLWQRALTAGEFWVAHWEELLKQLEPQAFGDMKVVRDFNPPKNRKVDPPRPVPFYSAKKVARYGARLFLCLWTVLIIILTVAVKCPCGGSAEKEHREKNRCHQRGCVRDKDKPRESPADSNKLPEGELEHEGSQAPGSR